MLLFGSPALAQQQQADAFMRMSSNYGMCAGYLEKKVDEIADLQRLVADLRKQLDATKKSDSKPEEK